MKKITHVLIVGLLAAIPFAVFFLQPRRNPEPTISSAEPKKLIAHSVKHLGLIMDGNRRWAKKHGLSELEGHSKGCEPVKMAVRFCVDQKIPHLTLYAFSLENFKRSADELNHIFSLIEPGLSGPEFDEIISRGVRIRFVGDKTLMPERLQTTIKNLETKTINGTALNLNILFCYGGKQEMVTAVKELAHKVAKKEYNPDEITVELLHKSLWCGHSPDLDLVIRTGGDQRLSNFMLWQSAYCEFLFLKKYWPEITYEDLALALEDFTQRQRRFGS